MGESVNSKLKSRIWELVEPSLNGYSRLIDTLLSAMTEEQLRDIIQILED